MSGARGQTDRIHRDRAEGQARRSRGNLMDRPHCGRFLAVPNPAGTCVSTGRWLRAAPRSPRRRPSRFFFPVLPATLRWFLPLQKCPSECRRDPCRTQCPCQPDPIPGRRSDAHGGCSVGGCARRPPRHHRRSARHPPRRHPQVAHRLRTGRPRRRACGLRGRRHLRASARGRERTGSPKPAGPKDLLDARPRAGSGAPADCSRSTSSAPMGSIDAPIDTADQADALALLLDALEASPCLEAFVGYSYGALVGLQLAIAASRNACASWSRSAARIARIRTPRPGARCSASAVDAGATAMRR
jgi:hypothetical protein